MKWLYSVAILLGAGLGLCAVTFGASALEPRQLVLIANRKVPQSVELARFYAEQRGVPAEQIVELDLPVGEEISFAEYEESVLPSIRSFLREGQLQNRIACLVTFYGVPIKIGPRPDAKANSVEAAEVTAERTRVMRIIGESVKTLEKLAVEYEPGFAPQTRGEDLDALARRVEQSGARLAMAVQRERDPQKRQGLLNDLGKIHRELNSIGEPATQPATTAAAPATTQPTTTARRPPTLSETAPPATTQLAESQEEILRRLQELEQRRFDPAARAELRDLARRKTGPIGYARILEVQADYLSPATDDGADAFDNELALIGWPSYARSRWRPNSLFYGFANNRLPPIALVGRIDGPTPEIARKLIVDSIATEKAGLSGKVVIDAQGLKLRTAANGTQDPKAVYDGRLRDLAKFLREKTKLDVTLDDEPGVLAAGSQQDVALYCGWYSLANYVPACQFVRGAVGYHVASFEMTTLRDPGNRGWVKGLLADGVVGTLGPVAEPYLHAFPYPDDFIPLLLTGKFTLAEVYWLSNPLTSWKMSLVGDPLYNPYKTNPLVRVEDLPRRLASMLAPQVIGPTTAPRP